MRFSINELAAPCAVARGLMGKLIGPQGVDMLARSEDLSAAFSLLERTAYGGVIGRVPRVGRVFRAVEHALRQSLIDDAINIWHFLGRSHRHMLKLIMSRYEITNMKTVFAAIEGWEDPKGLRDSLFDLGPLGRIGADDLVESASITGLAEALRGSPYGGVLTSAMERYRSEGTLFGVEVALDLYYFRRLLHAVRKLCDYDRGSLLSTLGPEIDNRNLLWVLRYKLNFALEPEEIFNYIAPGGYELNDEVLWNVAKADGVQDIASILPPGYRALVERSRRGEKLDLVRLDVLLRRRLWRRARAAITRYPFSLGMILGYLVIKRLELDEIITVLEGKRYGMTDDEMVPFLIHREMAEGSE
ncbi:MAG: V-type ATPase subunit [Firmicutes bacterium]|nr:V-type ATPase subunit [Bacillota bacterium]